MEEMNTNAQKELEKFNERFYDSVRNMTDNSPDPMAVDLQER